jgi:hypothetical protein
MVATRKRARVPGSLDESPLASASTSRVPLELVGGHVQPPRMVDYFRLGKLTDVTILVDGRSYAAHRNVLAAASDYLDRLFAGPAWADQEEPVRLSQVRSPAPAGGARARRQFRRLSGTAGALSLAPAGWACPHPHRCTLPPRPYLRLLPSPPPAGSRRAHVRPDPRVHLHWQVPDARGRPHLDARGGALSADRAVAAGAAGPGGATGRCVQLSRGVECGRSVREERGGGWRGGAGGGGADWVRASVAAGGGDRGLGRGGKDGATSGGGARHVWLTRSEGGDRGWRTRWRAVALAARRADCAPLGAETPAHPAR